MKPQLVSSQPAISAAEFRRQMRDAQRKRNLRVARASYQRALGCAVLAALLCAVLFVIGNGWVAFGGFVIEVVCCIGILVCVKRLDRVDAELKQ